MTSLMTIVTMTSATYVVLLRGSLAWHGVHIATSGYRSPLIASLISHRSPPMASLIRYGELLHESLARHGAFVAPRPRVKPEGVKPEGVKPEGVKPEGVQPEGVKPEGAVVVRTAVSAAGGTLELLQVRLPLMASHRLSSPLIASDDL